MRAIKILFTAILLMTAISFAKAELPAPLIEVKDTLYHAKSTKQSAGGAVYLPDGNSIILLENIYIWPNDKSIPVLIDSKTGNEIRKFDTIPNSPASNPQVSKDGRYLFSHLGNGTIAVWDIETGKFLKYIDNAWSFCLSPDGTKIYTTHSNVNGTISVYDANKLEYIETFCGHQFNSAYAIACSPDSKQLAVSVFHPEKNYDKTSSVIIIDLENKSKYYDVENIVPFAKNLQFSPDGKYLIYHKTGTNSKERYIMLYNINNSTKNYLIEEDISKLFEYKTDMGFRKIFNDRLISIEYSKYSLIWDIYENKLKKIINFKSPYIDINNNKILLCDYKGNLAQLDFDEVSVNEGTLSNSTAISYLNNQLEFLSDKVFVGDVLIYDISGKMIANLGTQSFVMGKNLIQINQQLQKAVYIVLIESKTEQIIKKFLVE